IWFHRLQGKVALITGGASGIGAAAAALFAHNGAKVIIADVQSELGHSVAEQITSTSLFPVAYVQCDVSKESDVENAVNGAVSSHGSVTTTFGNAPHAYTASKHAVVGLMKNLTVELGGYGIRVNSVSPDGVPTPMAMKAMGMDRKAVQELGSQRASLKGTMLDENDVAEAAMYLASEESKFVSGLNLVVDGGYNLKSA
ncbi:unnamed protein product, partial [Linum tenue]